MLTKPNTLPAFGSIIQGQGGAFVGIMRGPTIDGVQQPPLALIKADASHEIEAEWGTRGQVIAGCESRTDGLANTQAMQLANCPAAEHARRLVADGHNDFFLPSIGQLNCAAANAPELFTDDGIYWSSTQTSGTTAFVQDFEHGYSYWYYKDNYYRVAPVRVISLEILTA